MARPQPSGPMVSAIVMATILAIYLVLVGWRALQFLQTGNPVAVVMGGALLGLPLIGAGALGGGVGFGGGRGRVVGGRGVGFSVFGEDGESSPDSWRVWLRLGVVYEAAGDRRRARQAIRHAIELAQQNRQDRRE